MEPKLLSELSPLAQELLGEIQAKSLGPLPVPEPHQRQVSHFLGTHGRMLWTSVAGALRMKRGKKSDRAWLRKRCPTEIQEFLKQAIAANEDMQFIEQAEKEIGSVSDKRMGAVAERMVALGELMEHPHGARVILGEEAEKDAHIRQFVRAWFDHCNERLSCPSDQPVYFPGYAHLGVSRAYAAAFELLFSSVWILVFSHAKPKTAAQFFSILPGGSKSFTASTRLFFNLLEDARPWILDLRQHAYRIYNEPVRIDGQSAPSWHELLFNQFATIGCDMIRKIRPTTFMDSPVSTRNLSDDEILSHLEDLKTFRISQSLLQEIQERVEFEAGKFDVMLSPQPAAVASHPEVKFQAEHSIDYRSVTWGVFTFTFTASQAVVVKTLWENWERGTPDVGVATLFAAVDHAKMPDSTESCSRMNVLFRNHPAKGKGKMIVPGATKGAFRLARPDVAQKGAARA